MSLGVTIKPMALARLSGMTFGKSQDPLAKGGGVQETRGFEDLSRNMN